eukprot:CAMPEP_0180199514 /NCGR_PEP_ID=MMETSP0987-20121128/5755_1 /TAXON_ID=697907 /ORGANISM="non described non described, Strain CCMP2293" /LENGTH=90 /DNA_ID=CAMNT_0022154615 /DNA_START=623 /DNA_END=893 /DNA_ORIENTATION=+
MAFVQDDVCQLLRGGGVEGGGWGGRDGRLPCRLHVFGEHNVPLLPRPEDVCRWVRVSFLHVLQLRRQTMPESLDEIRREDVVLDVLWVML